MTMKNNVKEIKAKAEAMGINVEGMNKAQMLNAINEAEALAIVEKALLPTEASDSTTEEAKEAIKAEKHEEAKEEAPQKEEVVVEAVDTMYEAMKLRGVQFKNRAYVLMDKGNFDRPSLEGGIVNNFESYKGAVNNLFKHLYTWKYNGGKLDGKEVTVANIRSCLHTVCRELGLNEVHTEALTSAFMQKDSEGNHTFPVAEGMYKPTKTNVQKFNERIARAELEAVQNVDVEALPDEEAKKRHEIKLAKAEKKYADLLSNAEYVEERMKENKGVMPRRQFENWACSFFAGNKWAEEALTAKQEELVGKLRRATAKAKKYDVPAKVILQYIAHNDGAGLMEIANKAEEKYNKAVEKKAKETAKEEAKKAEEGK